MLFGSAILDGGKRFVDAVELFEKSGLRYTAFDVRLISIVVTGYTSPPSKNFAEYPSSVI